MSIYLFVDGAYLDNAYKGLMDVFDVPGALNIRAIAARPFECAADRIFYYHAVDTSNGKDESDDECAARVQALEARLDTINGYESFHVREGTVGKQRDKRRRQQKQVDVQLAVDMLTHSFSKNITRAILLAGDLDFLPVVDAVANLGVMVEVWYEKRTVAKALYRRADRARPITVENAFNWTDARYREQHQLLIPSRHGDSSIPINAPHRRFGHIAGRTVALWQSGDSWMLKTDVGGVPSDFRHPDKDTLTRFIGYEYGTIEWQ